MRNNGCGRVIMTSLVALVLSAAALADTTFVTIGNPSSSTEFPFEPFNWPRRCAQLLYSRHEIGGRSRISGFALYTDNVIQTTFYDVRIRLCPTSAESLSANLVANRQGNTPVTVFSASSMQIGTPDPYRWFNFPCSLYRYAPSENLIVEVMYNDAAAPPNGIPMACCYVDSTRVAWGTSDTATNGYVFDHNLMYTRLATLPWFEGQLSAPNGGEYYPGAAHVRIAWEVFPKDFFYTRLLLSTDGGSTFPEVIAASLSPVDTSYDWTAPQYNSAMCRVKVQAYDSTNTVVMEDASDGNFTIDSEAPSAPALVFPPANGATNNPAVVFLWHRASDNLAGIGHYTIQVAYDSLFSALVDTSRCTDTTRARSLPADTAYYWRVRATDRCGNVGAWSATWHFEIDAQAPGVPTLLTPLGGPWLESTTVPFAWTPVQFGPGKVPFSPVSYAFQMDTIRGIRPIYSDTTAVPTDTFAFLPEAKYWWRVRAFDAAGNSGAFTGMDSFGIDLSNPQTPLLIYPPHLSQVASDTTHLVWHESSDNVSGVEFYHVQLALDTAFADSVQLPTPTTPDTTVFAALPDSASYYWRVRAKDYAGNWTPWSLVYEFSYPLGLAEQPPIWQGKPSANQTVHHGVVLLQESLPAVLLDVCGRHVTNLRPGLNSLSGLKAGIYYVVGEVSQPTRKVIVTD